MARFGIVFGLLLCGLTVVGLVTSVKVPAQFIPMMIGIPIMICSIVGLNPHRRKQSMHGAASVGLLGLVVGAFLSISLGRRLPDESIDVVFRVVLALAVLCLVFVTVCVISFLQARARRSV